MTFQHKDLVETASLTVDEIWAVLNQAQRFAAEGASPLLAGKTITTAFFENSTRTRLSFTQAAYKLGAHVLDFAAQASSLSKGESFKDTLLTLEALGSDALVIRHPESGAAQQAADYFQGPVINGGDGKNEHPTQALLDAFTLWQAKEKMEGLTILICGDTKHSRVARSNIHTLTKLGCRVRLAGPAALATDITGKNISTHTRFEEAIEGVDAVMMLRVQRERLESQTQVDASDYVTNWQLTPERFALARKDAVILHPGPMLRGFEITDGMADHAQSLIQQQVRNGVLVRMACLALLLRNRTQ